MHAEAGLAVTARDHCREFLPALLEITETPPLAAGRRLLYAMVLLLPAAIAWTCIGRVDVVSVAGGKVLPPGGAQRVQPVEGGIIRRILIAEGEQVIAGQSLVELDPVEAAADLESIRQQAAALRIDQALDDEVLRIMKEPAAGTGARLRLPSGTSRVQRQQAAIRLEARVDEFHSRMQAIEDELRVKQGQRNTAAARIAQLDSTLPLVAERADAVKALLARGVVPRMQWLELEQLRVGQLSERNAQAAVLAVAEAEITAVAGRRGQLRAEMESSLLAQRAEASHRLAGLEQQEIKALQRLELRTLVAPVSGRVHLLAVHTEGGVVAPGEELLRIVPARGIPEIEALVPNRDIGFVHEGQAAVIKLDAFPFTRYGTLPGKVATLSADAVELERAGLYYVARILPDAGVLVSEGRRYALEPGMTAVVEIRLGTRRVVDFLLAPLKRHWDESLRER